MAELAVGLIGAGRIGTSHARVLAERVPGARLAVVADPRPGAAATLAAQYGARSADSAALLAADDVQAVVMPRRRPHTLI